MKFFSVSFLLILLCACSGKTMVILLPNEDNTTGAVFVRTDQMTKTIDQPYGALTVSGKTPPSIEHLDKSQVDAQYGTLLATEPSHPIHFILYFLKDSTEMNPASKALIPKILAAAKAREPSEINIIGHSDTMGEPDYNVRLALKRAKAVAKVIRDQAPGKKEILVQSFGENDLLVPTADDVSEWRNRRVEIMIR